MDAVRLLVVDDHSDVRFLIRMIVQEHAGEVEVAGEADGSTAALELLDSVDPDVVVLDAMMPMRDGYETAALIRERRPQQLIVLCTALVDDSVRERAAAAGIDAIVGKDEFDRIPQVALGLAGRG